MREDNQMPLRSLVFVQDITHLLKDDFYWTRIIYGDEKTCVKGYFSSTKEEIEGEIISEREKEILSLLVQGKTTSDIAQTLFISPNTVNNHRQNILNKLGAKDTTALIHLARITGFV
jgi:DNA-binding NarL/FixJ family response regulator